VAKNKLDTINKITAWTPCGKKTHIYSRRDENIAKAPICKRAIRKTLPLVKCLLWNLITLFFCWISVDFNLKMKHYTKTILELLNYLQKDHLNNEPNWPIQQINVPESHYLFIFILIATS